MVRRRTLSFHTHNLAKRVDDFDQIGLRSHYRVNRLIGRRGLVNDVRILSTFDASRHAPVVFDRKSAFGLAAGHGAAGTVAAAHEALGMAFAADDVGTGAHAAGNDAHVADLRAHSTLAGDENVLAVVALARHVVVLAVDGLHVRRKGPYPAGIADRFDDLADHEVAIDARKVLSPFDRLDVIPEMFGVLWEIRQVLVRQILNQPLHVFFGELDEVGAHAVPDAAGAAVQEEPDVLGLVETDFDEVIAGAQGAKVIGVVAAVEFGVFFKDGVVAVSEFGDPNFEIAGGDDLPGPLIALATMIRSSVRHGFFDCGANCVKIVGKVPGV